MFNIKKKRTIKLIPGDKEIEYHNAIGFFEFQGEIFYKSDKNCTAHALNDPEVSFISHIKKQHYETYGSITSFEVGKLKVLPLSLEN